MPHQLTRRVRKIEAISLIVETELYEELFGLHEKYGFANVKAFLNAVSSATRKKGRKVGPSKKASPAPKTRKRAKITDATRAKVKKLVKARKTGSWFCPFVLPRIYARPP